jgi:hypothetical protein
MRTVFAALALLCAAFPAARLGWCDAPDAVMLGRDRLTLAAPDSSGELKTIVMNWWAAERRARTPAGRPFRNGVELSAEKPGDLAQSAGQVFVRLGDYYDLLEERDVGLFVEKVETERDFKSLLRRLYNVGTEDWLSPCEFQAVLRRVEAAPVGLRLNVVSRQIEPDVITRGAFRRDGVWLAALVVRQAASLVEFKFAIDEKKRVGYHRRTLIEGPRPPGRGAGTILSYKDREEWLAFDLARPFLLRAIEAAKAECAPRPKSGEPRQGQKRRGN